MPIHITVDAAATYAANHILNGEGITGLERKKQLPVRKYNLLVTAFNSSTVLLVTSVGAAILFNSVSSVTFLAVGLFTRWTTEKELKRYTLPLPNREKSLRDRFIDLLQDEREREENVFERVGQPYQEGWNIDEWIIFDYVVWKNKI